MVLSCFVHQQPRQLLGFNTLKKKALNPQSRPLFLAGAERDSGIFFRSLLRAAERRGEEGRFHKSDRAVCQPCAAGNTEDTVETQLGVWCMIDRGTCPGRMLLMPLTQCVREVGVCVWQTWGGLTARGWGKARSKNIWK